MRRSVYFGVTGLITGIISTHEVFIDSFILNHVKFISDDLMLYIFPGLIFGVFISLVDYIYSKKFGLFHILFIPLSIGAYYLAVSSVLIAPQLISLYLAGFIGSTILALGIKFKYKLSFLDILAISSVGTVFVWPGDRNYLFPIWQCFVGAIIGYILELDEKLLKNN